MVFIHGVVAKWRDFVVLKVGFSFKFSYKVLTLIIISINLVVLPIVSPIQCIMFPPHFHPSLNSGDMIIVMPPFTPEVVCLFGPCGGSSSFPQVDI